MKRPFRISDALMLLLLLALAGCGGGFPVPATIATSLTVSPASLIVTAGSTTTFTAVFVPVYPDGGSLTWSVNPATGGTINNGVYVASANPATYTISATWTPANPGAATTLVGTASVEVLAVPPVSIFINPAFVQAAGAVGNAGGTQNTGIVGQHLAYVISKDGSGHVVVQNGFVMPTGCAPPKTKC